MEKIKQGEFFSLRGRVLESTSLIIRASVPLVSLGEMVHITTEGSSSLIPAQVVGFRESDVFLMPLGDTSGLSPNSQVIPNHKAVTIRVGYSLLGRVLNGLGEPIDGLAPLSERALVSWPIYRQAPDPYQRKPVKDVLSLGIKAIDSLLTVGKGQRIGLFAGSGVGKSSLMGQIVKNTEAKIAVICLVGERGREVKEFIDHTLAHSLNKCVVIVATSDQPSLVRALSCYVATSIAEWFRDQGEDVLFLMDSATRFARAQREIGLALGEPPARQGYPPSVFAEIPKLMERTGANHLGSITAIYTVLVQGGDFDEPISDEVRGILDGHIILNRDLAEKSHWPAIDVLASLSRVMNNLVDEEQKKACSKLRSWLSIYEKNRDLISLGAYKIGSDPKIDEAIKKHEEIMTFLQQPIEENFHYQEIRKQLLSVVGT